MINLGEVYNKNKFEIDKALMEICEFMRLNQKLEKCDLIIGCGCAALDIPVKCAQLYKDGYAPKVLFTGGLGKITEETFSKPEAEVFCDIAISKGVNLDDILIETKSTNTGDNFRLSKLILDENNIKYDKVLIVHNPFNERRTYLTAKSHLKNKKIIITSTYIAIEDYLKRLSKKPVSQKKRVNKN